MKNKKYLLATLLLIFLMTGCVAEFAGFQGKTDNGFFMTVKDKTGNEISTGASINDPEQVLELRAMYEVLVKELSKIMKEQRQ